MRKLLQCFKEIEISNKLIDLLDQHDMGKRYGLICLHRENNIIVDPIYLIYSKNEWFSFHRYFTGVYPVSEDHFFEECKEFFPALFFHEEISKTIKTLEGGLSQFAKIIIESLSALNDSFKSSLHKSGLNNLTEILQDFSVANGLVCTLEGSNKKRLKLSFLNDKKQTEDVTCEPHIKLERSDEKGDNHHYYNRIYFHPGKPGIAAGKILIGHIGKHL